MAGGRTDFDDVYSSGKKVPTALIMNWRQSAGETPVDAHVFIATRACKLAAIRAVLTTPGTDAGAVSLQVRKCTGTQGPAAGTALLTNNTNAGFDLKGAANTVQNGALTGTAASLLMAAGDRLSFDFSGVMTALAGLAVTFEVEMA